MCADEFTAQPVEVELDRTRELRIVWADGRRSAYPLARLRRDCPCAACRQLREEQDKKPLRVVQAASEQREMAIADGIELVGHYGVRISWKDGHNAGIYEYAWLRALADTEPAAT